MAEKQGKNLPPKGKFYENLQQRQRANLRTNALLAVMLLLVFAYGYNAVQKEMPSEGNVNVDRPAEVTTQLPSAETAATTQITEGTQYTEITEASSAAPSTEITQTTEQTQYTEYTEHTEHTEATQPSKEPETTVATEPSKPTETTEVTEPETVPPMQILVTQFTSEVSLIPESARAFSVRDMSVPVQTAIYQYKKPNVRLDAGLPVTLSVQITNMPEGLSVASITMEVTENASTQTSWTFQLTQQAQSVQLWHLKVDTTYDYRVSVAFSDGSQETIDSSFKTAATPRLLTIEGIVNVRDIGGWKTVDGKTIRQGLLYRGSELEGAVSPAFQLTDKGLEDMLTALGIRTDMDLRSKDENIKGLDALGAEVKHIYYGARGYEDIFEERYMEAIRAVFSDLADPSKYPIYLHCTYGADRTGTICYLLEALLGLSEEDLLREYELSALYYSWANSQKMDAFIATLKTFAGETMQEKVQSYLRTVGVTDAEMESIKTIFLEEK